MDKIKIIIGLIITFILIYFLQLYVFNNFTIAGIKPNMFIILIIYIALNTNKKYIIILGAIYGIILDLLINNVVGITSLLFIIIGIVTSYLEKYLSKESKLTIILIVIGSTIVYEFSSYILQAIKFESVIEIKEFFKRCSIEVIYNTILTIIIYPIWRKTGPYVEEKTKITNSVTGY